MTEEEIEKIADAVLVKLKAASKDNEVMGDVWKQGASTMGQHAADAFSLWVGRKVILFVVGVVFSALLAWSVLKKAG